jgi:FMN-dependent oxidoreductase (nitrilotriacetate monooxygenase family)
MTARKQMALALLASGTGSHVASWLHPATTPSGGTDVNHYRRLAQLAERGKFDLFFIADTPAARTEKLDAYARFPIFMNVFEPVTLLSVLAGATTHIGLGGTVSTSFSEPYNVARQFASLDHISAGRAGWNVVTSANDFAAGNFGHAALPPHADRYARAQEFVQVVQALWDSWDDGAFIRDRAQGLFFDPGAQHKLTHRGPHFTVEGALNIERTPQGKPVIIQAGASETGKEFAAETAEVVFASNTELARSASFYADLKGRMAKYRRAPDELKVLAGLPIIVGESEQEAQDKYAALQGLIHPDVGRLRLGMDLELDLSDLPLDEPIPEELIPRTSNLHQMYFNRIVEMIRTEKLTLRQLYMRYERGNKTLCGTVQTIADHMEAWLTGGAADGFMLNFPTLPDCLQDFVQKVVPELQRRGIFRQDYTGTTLRDHLGLARPANRFTVARPNAAE